MVFTTLLLIQLLIKGYLKYITRKECNNTFGKHYPTMNISKHWPQILASKPERVKYNICKILLATEMSFIISGVPLAVVGASCLFYYKGYGTEKL